MKTAQWNLNLQLFADGEGGNEGEQTPPETSFAAPQSQSELDSLIGKAVNTALTKAKNDWDQQTTQQIEQVKTQAEKLAQMSAEEKAAEAEKERLTHIETREAQLMQRELKATAIDILAEKEIPIKLAEILHYKDSDTTKAHLDVVIPVVLEIAEQLSEKQLMRSVKVPGSGGEGQSSTQSELIAKEKNAQQTPKTSLWG